MHIQCGSWRYLKTSIKTRNWVLWKFVLRVLFAKELKTLGSEVITGLGKTGVVGILKNGPGPIAMYRADVLA